MIKFNLQTGMLEVRSCNIHLTQKGEHVTYEIIQWHDGHKTNHTVAYWIFNGEHFDLMFVGNRPFSCDPAVFWKLAKAGQELLDLNCK